MNTRTVVFPPTYFVAALVTMIGLHYVFPFTRVVPPPYNYLGAVLIFAGVTGSSQPITTPVGLPLRQSETSENG